MQEEPYLLRAKLLEAVDSDYNVKDMPLILEVLGKLEVLNVSKEILESTRLGKTVNEFRRKVNDAVLARRLKDLVKKWRDAVIPQQQHPLNGASSESSSIGSIPGSSLPPNFGSGYTSASSSPIFASRVVSPTGSSNSLSPRTGSNYTNNNTSVVHSLAANRNGSSSIANNRNNNRQLLTSSYANQLVSPSTTSPFLNSRSLVSPHKSKSPGGLSAFNSNNSSSLSPFPTTYYTTSASSYAPNAETASCVEPPAKRPKLSAVNGTLDDPTLALDDNSRDSYASRGSTHSDGFASKDPRFAVSAPSPATPGQASVLSPQMPVPGTDFNAPSPATPLDAEAANSILQSEVQPKRKRRKKQNEFFQDTEAILREKIAQAQAEKAAKLAKEKEMQLKEREAALNSTTVDRRSIFEESFPEDKLANNVFVEKYLKSQTELRAKMEKDAVDALSASDFQGAAAEESNQSNIDTTLSKKERKKLKRKQDKTVTDVMDAAASSNSAPFPSESQILAKLPPLDPEILKEFANFEYDVNPSPPPPTGPSEAESGGTGVGDAFNSYNKETESVNNNLKSLSSSTEEEKPRKIDWGDSDDDDEESQQEKEKRLEEERQAAEADIISQQVEVISSEYVSDPTAEYLTKIALSSENNNKDQQPQQHQEPGTRGINDLDLMGVKRDISEEDVEAYTKDPVPSLNGNYDNEGQFREWHETLTIDSYQGPLYILPYTIIDF